VLTHVSGFTYGFHFQHPLDELYRARDLGNFTVPSYDLAEAMARLGEVPLLFDPGTRWNYSVSTDVCGRIVEVVSGLPLDEEGFLLTEATLKTTADAPVFAVGDAGTIRNQPVPKAGVYAVRQGPVLWENLRRALRGEPLKPYRPQQRFLKLLNRGDGTALGEYGQTSFEGAWAWRLKDWIDVRFVEKYQNLEPMPMEGDASPMRCHGCGSKLASTSLFRALRWCLYGAPEAGMVSSSCCIRQAQQSSKTLAAPTHRCGSCQNPHTLRAQ
jgi:hypothetical protein